MASGVRNSSGIDTDDLYETDTVGDGPSAPGFRRSNGVELKYAKASHGTPGDPMGCRLSNGVDIGTLWSRKGTAVYALPINGASYTSNSQTRGEASVTWDMKSDGSYVVTKREAGTFTVLATGTWLPSGEAIANYSCSFTYTQGSQQTIDGGSTSNTTNAPTPSALTTSRNFVSTSQTVQTSDRANQDVSVTMKLYKSGALQSTTQVEMHTNGNGY